MGGLRQVDPLALIFLTFLFVLIPVAVLRRARTAPAPDPGRRLLYYGLICVQLACFGLLSWCVAARLRIPLWHLPRSPLLAWAGAGALVALFFYALAPYRRARIARGDMRAFTMAPGKDQLGAWALVSLSAGVAEELTYRGVASAILLYAGLPAWAVVLAVSAAFALGHADRGWFHVAATFGIAALLHLLVLVSGSLWPAMAAHAVYDFFAGWSYGRMAREAGRASAGA
jgi:membrane protease YdiL (CAAX protease family)